MDFLMRLRKELENFNLTTAENLSEEIHRAEMKGYEIGVTEDRLWAKLTAKILEARKK